MSTTTANTSTEKVLSSLVVNVVIFGIFVGAFLLLRIKFKRIYSPKSSYDLVPEDKKPEALPSDPFRWIFILLRKPSSFIIQQAGLDGYFFLRYLFVFGLVFLFGILMFTVLLPINAVGGAGGEGFDRFSISNVTNRKRYYAHAVMSWLFYGIVVFVIFRELYFYNSLRAATIASPKYARKLSSRTLLFQCVPDSLLDNKQAFKLFYGVKRVYVPRMDRKLSSKVNERKNMFNMLEGAENKLITMAVKKHAKLAKKNKLDTITDQANINSYVPEKKRPHFKPEGFFSRRKVDTIDYCKKELQILDAEVKKLQKTFRKNPPRNSMFVEFENQYYCQLAYQTTSYHSPMKMSSKFTGMEPGDIKWTNTRLFWWEWIVRRFIAIAAATVLILLWAVPVAFVGTISNLTYLTNKIHWLRWLLKLPKPILGAITGYLPTIMLAILMALLPLFIRAMAVVAGCPTNQSVERWTQSVYFAFLIINGFLITTISSSATSTITQIASKPEDALSILANGLPKSSNFYVAYLMLQGLSIAGAALFQIVGFFLYYIFGFFFDSTVRKKWERFSGLSAMAWGTTFPLYTTLVCITLAYSIISPLILLFATASFFLLYIAYAYNLTYVFTEVTDSRGAHYPTALFQTFTGLYLGQICLLGLFAVGKGWGPIAMQLIGIGFTVFAHVHLQEAFSHLLKVVPIDCMMPLDGVSETPSYKGTLEYEGKVLRKRHNHKYHKENSESEHEQKHKNENEHEHENENDNETNSDGDLEKATNTVITCVPLLAEKDFKESSSRNYLIRFLRPDVYLNFKESRKILPASYFIDDGGEDAADDVHAYDLPHVGDDMDIMWLPKDPYGFSDMEIENMPSVIRASNENAGFASSNSPIYFGEPPTEPLNVK